MLSKVILDNCPLLYKLSIQSHPGPNAFKFQHMWFHRPGFMDVVQRSWAIPLAGYGMLLFSLKLKRLKTNLRIWNKEHFGDAHQNVQTHEMDLREKESSL